MINTQEEAVVPGSTKVGRFRTSLRQIGPALVLASVVVGPGSLTLHTVAGSAYGYQLLWVPVIATSFMILYTWMSARIALAAKDTLFGVTRRLWGTRLAQVGGIFGYMAILAFQSGNSVATGFAADALLGGGVWLWAIITAVMALGIMFLPNLYTKLEVLVKLVVGLMLFTFLATLVTVGIDVPEAAGGLVPTLPDAESVFLMLGMTATTFSIAAAVYQGYLIKEKYKTISEAPGATVDVVLGIGALGSISIIILLTSAGVIQATTGASFTAQQMASQLEPLAGPVAFYLFNIGFFLASFSSLIVNPMIGATLLMDGFGRDVRMDGRPVKTWSVVALAAGLVPVLLFEGTPVELLRIAQGMSVVAFPVLGWLMLRITSNRSVMGAYTTKRPVQIFALLGYLALLGIVLNYLRQIIGL